MRTVDAADMVLTNARILTLDPLHPRAQALAIRSGRLISVGSLSDVRQLVGTATQILDAEGGVVVPAFHDAHLHLLSYARHGARLDCGGLRSISELKSLLARQASRLPPGAWLRATGLDESHLAEGRQPDRFDAAVADHPVRLQHRTLHLDVLNSTALRHARLFDLAAPQIERDPSSGEPTGRLYQAVDLLHARMPRPTETELSWDVRQACERLLTWGITTVQDASVTNGRDEWELFSRLARRGDLPLRIFVMPGERHWRELEPARGVVSRVRLGPVKLMLDEATCDPAEVHAVVAAVRKAGRAVALHAVTEAEIAVALGTLQSAGARDLRLPPDRIEHAAVIPDGLLDDLRMVGVTVVGQPGLVYRRGDTYRANFPAEQHGWLHRAGSLLRAGVPYAVSSDAPITEPCPGLALFAAQSRRTSSGAVLGPDEALSTAQALSALTLGPARAIGAEADLGQLRPGMLADLAVLDPEYFEADSRALAVRPVRLTITEGKVVWRRPLAA